MDQRKLDEIKKTLDIFRARLPIKPDALEIMCVDQPVLYDGVGQLVTEWQAEAKTAGERLGFVKADQSSKIRTNPQNFGVSKITEGAVESAALLTKEYGEASKDLIDTEKILGYLRVLQEALNQRKSSLNNLVELWIHEYYSKVEGGMAKERRVLTDVTEQQIIETRVENARRRAEENKQPLLRQSPL
jgi:hypothetical protein